jgi:hypothetical protein
MARTHITLAFATILASAPLVGSSVAGAAEPATTRDRATPTAPGDSMHVNRTNEGSAAPRVPNADSNAPATPIPMNLPDDANASEVKGEYGIGIAGLILGTVLVAAIVVGALYVISRRSWSASH